MNISQVLQQMRDKNPLVHCITNYVAMNVAANTLLAAGASPAMVHTPEEAGDFAKVANALTVNIGTLSPHWVDGMKKAAQAACDSGIPWVLDPVAHFATPYRAKVTQELMSLKPAIIRGNASEIIALGDGKTSAEGVDAKDSVGSAEEFALDLAQSLKTVVMVTGEIDFVTDGRQAIRIGGGSVTMTLVTALGCSLTCLIGAFAAVAEPLEASVAALTLFAEAGQRAEKSSNGPGSFLPAFLDSLHNITPRELEAADWIL